MSIFLILRFSDSTNLEHCARDLKRTLNLPLFETRQSDNYPGGHYSQCQVLGLSLKISMFDYHKFPKYGFTLSLEPLAAMMGDGLSLDGLADVIARRLAFNGCDVIIEENHGRAGTPFTVYRKNPTQDAPYSERIITDYVSSDSCL